MARAWAPPTACTSSTPSSAQAASTAGWGRGPRWGPGGGGAPARPTGTYRAVTLRPPAGETVFSAGGSWASCTSRARRASSSRARATAGSTALSAASRASGGTRVVSRSTPSNRAVYSRTAAAPRWRTSSHTGRICSAAAATSRVARGRVPDRLTRLSAASSRSRRSIREITRSVYGAGSMPAVFVHIADTGATVAADVGHQLGQADGQGREQGPEDQRALGAQRQRGVQVGAVRLGQQRVLERGAAVVAADPPHDGGGAQAAQDQARGGRRAVGTAVAADHVPVAENPGQQAAGGGDQHEPGVGRDERGGLGVDHAGRAPADHLGQGARRDQGPDVGGGDAEDGGAGQGAHERGDGGAGITWGTLRAGGAAGVGRAGGGGRGGVVCWGAGHLGLGDHVRGHRPILPGFRAGSDGTGVRDVVAAAVGRVGPHPHDRVAGWVAEAFGGGHPARLWLVDLGVPLAGPGPGRRPGRARAGPRGETVQG